MDLGLKGRNAVVLGGTRGIGRAIAETLAAEGAGVAICARDAGVVASTVAELKAIPRPLIAFLDPDTGISPTKRANPEHVAWSDLERIWEALENGDVLVVYQHADRSSGWTESRRNLLSDRIGAPCQMITGKEIAGDVALLWCQKTAR